MNLALFVHGLAGAPHKTWGKFPGLVVADADLDWQVAMFQYPSLLIRLPLQKNTPRIQILAAGLRTQIESVHMGAQSIALVCHSLGGLIAKRYIANELEAKRPLSVTHLVLFGVPNDGAELAAAAALISWRNYPLRQLCRDSDFLEHLNSDWTRLAPEHHLTIRHVLGGRDGIVSPRSASYPALSTTADVIVDRGHRDLVKPATADDLPFRVLKRCLLSTAHAFPNAETADPPASITDSSGETRGRNRSSVDVLSTQITKQVSSPAVRAVWQLSDDQAGHVLVVVGPDTQRIHRPAPRDPNFAYLDEFGDIDSIFEAMNFLARLFPDVGAMKYPASRVEADLLQQALVVIGGPIGEASQGGNRITEVLNAKSPLPIIYDLESSDPTVRVGSIVLASHRGKGSRGLARDAGIIMRCRNPWNPQRRMLVFQGIHTAGVLGGVRSISQSVVAERNCRTILQKLGDDPFFLALLEVNIENGSALPPDLDPSMLFPWERA